MQGLDVGAQDYASVHTELRGGTDQKQHPQGREEEHRYQRANLGKEKMIIFHAVPCMTAFPAVCLA